MFALFVLLKESQQWSRCTCYTKNLIPASQALFQLEMNQLPNIPDITILMKLYITAKTLYIIVCRKNAQS